jgi:hypothetical protein
VSPTARREQPVTVRASRWSVQLISPTVRGTDAVPLKVTSIRRVTDLVPVLAPVTVTFRVTRRVALPESG